MAEITYRYRLSRLAGDYLRSLVGLLLTAIPAIELPAGIGAYSLTALAVLFAGLAVQTLVRTCTRVIVTESSIQARPWDSHLLWAQLTAVELAYFSTRSDGRNGWMQLKLEVDGKGLRLDSRLDGFEDIVARAALSATQRALSLSPATVSNLLALRIDSRNACVPLPQGAYR